MTEAPNTMITQPTYEPADQGSGWAQQDSNLRPLGEHSPHYPMCIDVPDVQGSTLPIASVGPRLRGFSDVKVPADLGPPPGRRGLGTRAQLLVFALGAVIALAIAVGHVEHPAGAPADPGAPSTVTPIGGPR